MSGLRVVPAARLVERARIPAADNVDDLGSSDLRFAHVYGREIIGGDYLMERTLPDGTLVRWRLIEHPNRIQARNEITSQDFDILLIARQESGPWWKRLLRRALLNLLS